MIYVMSDLHGMYNKKGNIYIDCGVCYEIGKLGCLRLDDMREFYVENDF